MNPLSSQAFADTAYNAQLLPHVPVNNKVVVCTVIFQEKFLLFHFFIKLRFSENVFRHFVRLLVAQPAFIDFQKFSHNLLITLDFVHSEPFSPQCSVYLKYLTF